jgi:glyoxylase-like metal-dependent hydrolase (beta-lactamase superfamily II)
MKIFKTVCNSYIVNSYLLVASDNKGVLIDPACNDEAEWNRLQKIIKEHNVNLVGVIATHTHADHVMGAKFVLDAYPDAVFLMHKEGEPLYKATNDYSMIMGFKKREMPSPAGYVTDNEILHFSDIELQVFYTPGHAPGSICLYSKSDNVVFTGDVLFQSSIGRTDLPGGSFEVLKTSIYEKLFMLPENTIVLPGHGDSTTIEFEKKNNPYL